MEENIETIIVNTLSNIYDWDSLDLRTDFVSFLNNEYAIQRETLETIFDSYDSLPAKIKDSVTFSIRDFVSERLS